MLVSRQLQPYGNRHKNHSHETLHEIETRGHVTHDSHVEMSSYKSRLKINKINHKPALYKNKYKRYMKYVNI